MKNLVTWTCFCADVLVTAKKEQKEKHDRQKHNKELLATLKKSLLDQKTTTICLSTKDSFSHTCRPETIQADPPVSIALKNYKF